MSCFPELTYATYADGELAAAEIREIERHLVDCARCRELVAALREENRGLRAALDEPAPARAPAMTPAWRRAAAWIGLGVVALGLGWHAVPGAPAALDWWSLALEAVLFLVLNAGTLASLVAGVAVGTMAVLTAVGVVWLARPSPRAVGGLVGSLILAATPGPTAAFGTRAATEVAVGPGETVDGTLVVSGDAVRIEGVVSGDLIVAARTLQLSGVVRGDLIVAGGAADIRGVVEGNVYVLAGTFELRGHVVRSLYGLNRATTLQPGSRVGADLNLVGRTLDLGGTVGRSVWVFGERVQVTGEVGRDLEVRGHRLAMLAPARLGGDVVAHVEREGDVAIEPGVTIAGARRTRVVSPGRAFLAEPWGYFWVATNLFGALLLGCVALALVPGFVQRSAESVGAVRGSLGLGLGVLVLGPIAVLLGAITLVGLPLALTGLALYLFGLYAAKIVVGLFLGRALLPRRGSSARESLLPLLTGLSVLTLGFRIPLVGPVVQLAVVCLGLGALCTQLFRAARPPLFSSRPRV